MFEILIELQIIKDESSILSENGRNTRPTY